MERQNYAPARRQAVNSINCNALTERCKDLSLKFVRPFICTTVNWGRKQPQSFLHSPHGYTRCSLTRHLNLSPTQTVIDPDSITRTKCRHVLKSLMAASGHLVSAVCRNSANEWDVES